MKTIEQLILDKVEENLPEIIRSAAYYSWWQEGASTGRRYVINEIHDDYKAEATPHVISIKRGLRIVITKHPEDLGKLLGNCQDDPDHSDRFIQFCVFGDIRYA